VIGTPIGAIFGQGLHGAKQGFFAGANIGVVIGAISLLAGLVLVIRSATRGDYSRIRDEVRAEQEASIPKTLQTFSFPDESSRATSPHGKKRISDGS